MVRLMFESLLSCETDFSESEQSSDRPKLSMVSVLLGLDFLNLFVFYRVNLLEGVE